MVEQLKIRAVQMDLARQPETVVFIKSSIDFFHQCGYNYLVLYLEGRIRTKSFHSLPENESYSPDEIRDIVGYAQKYGIETIPVVSVFGHADLFLEQPENESCAELRGGIRGRFGTYNHVFCPTQPETLNFIERYLTEVAELFPSRYFHVGFDEAWEHPLGAYGKTASKRRGTIGQTARILTTENLLDRIAYGENPSKRTVSEDSAGTASPGISGTLMEGSNNRGAIAVTRITYPYEWGEMLKPGSTEERMATESIIKALRKEAKNYLPARLAELASRYGFKYEKLAIKNNLTNWGSCSSKGNINLNLHLIRLPHDLCDFVILHELCHLKHFNHGEGFHALFSRICAAHFASLTGEGREYPDEAALEKAFARSLRKYYLW